MNNENNGPISKFTIWSIRGKVAMVLKKKHFRIAAALILIGFLASALFATHHTPGVLAAPANRPEVPVTFSDTELLVKLNNSTNGKVKQNVSDTGIPSLDTVLKNKKVKKFERIASPNKKSLATGQIFNWYKVSLDPATIQTKSVEKGKTINTSLDELKKTLLADPNVVSVEPNYTVTNQTIPNDPYYGSTGSWGQTYADMWGLKRTNAEGAWSLTTGSTSVVIADIDTGADIANSDLAGNIWTNTGETGMTQSGDRCWTGTPQDKTTNGCDDDNNGYVDDVHGWNWVSSNNNVMDDNGHGTHTAGTIAALGNNGLGITGVVWNSSLMPLKFLNNAGSGDINSGAKAIIYAADNGAKVTSNSWGCNCHSQVLDDAIKYAHDKNVVTVVAAGNSTSDALDFSPASSDGAITVGASSSNDALASFSNYGSKVDVVAPGVDILSLKAAVSPVCSTTQIVGTNYCRLSGTSMATPHVSGLVALLLARNPSLSAEDVRQVLRSSAIDLGTAGRDMSFGYGLIDMNAAVSQAPSMPPSVYISSLASRASLGFTPVDVTGSAAGTGFVSYKLEIGTGRNPTSLTLIKSATTPVSNGVLGTINPSTLSDGSYTLRLTVTSSSGRTYTYELYDLIADNITTSIDLPNDLLPIGNTNINGSAFANNGGVISGYKLEYGSGTAPTTWITTGLGTPNGTSPVTSGTLSTWDTSSLSDGQAYTLRLTATLVSGAKDVVTAQLTADKTLVSGWPIALDVTATCATSCDGTPAFADLNADGQKELVVAAPGTNKIYAYRKDGTLLPGFPATVANSDWFNWPVVIADVNNDGYPEILASAIMPDGNSRLYILTRNGQQLAGWPNPTFSTNGNSSFSDISPSVADLDGDGVPEIITLNIYFPVSGLVKHTLSAMHADGTEITGFPKELAIQSSFLQYPITIADLDKDGKPEIAVGNYDKFYLFDNQGTILPGWPYQAPNINGQIATFQSTPSVGDIDGDGQLEVFSTATPNGMMGVQLPLYAWKKSGALVSGFPQQTGQYGNYHVGWPLNNTATADIDNDGKDEVVVGNNNVTIHKQTGIMSIAPAVGQGPVTISDFSGDGNLKINAGRFSGSDAMQLLNNDGSIFYHKDTSVSNSFTNPFVSADMDNNGRLEYAAVMRAKGASRAYLYLWEMPSTGNGSWPITEWPMFGQNPAHTNHFSRGSRITSDTTPPTVTLSAPVGGAQVSGTVTLSASATDNLAVAKVEFYVDGTLVSAITNNPYSYGWNSKLVANGTHTITAKAYDVANLSKTSSPVSITVNNLETIPPTVSITSPVNGKTVPKNNNYTIKATATDNVKVTKVEFYANGVLVCTSTVSPYSCVYKIGPLAGVKYTFMAKAYDAAGNTATSTVVVTSK